MVTLSKKQQPELSAEGSTTLHPDFQSSCLQNLVIYLPCFPKLTFDMYPNYVKVSFEITYTYHILIQHSTIVYLLLSHSVTFLSVCLFWLLIVVNLMEFDSTAI